MMGEQCERGNSQGWERMAVGGTTRKRKKDQSKAVQLIERKERRNVVSGACFHSQRRT